MSGNGLLDYLSENETERNKIYMVSEVKIGFLKITLKSTKISKAKKFEIFVYL